MIIIITQITHEQQLDCAALVSFGYYIYLYPFIPFFFPKKMKWYATSCFSSGFVYPVWRIIWWIINSVHSFLYKKLACFLSLNLAVSIIVKERLSSSTWLFKLKQFGKLFWSTHEQAWWRRLSRKNIHMNILLQFKYEKGKICKSFILVVWWLARLALFLKAGKRTLLITVPVGIICVAFCWVMSYYWGHTWNLLRSLYLFAQTFWVTRTRFFI